MRKFSAKAWLRFFEIISVALIILLGICVSKGETIRRFNAILYNSRIGHYQTRWLGCLIQQNPCDAWVYQEIIYKIKPDYIIETGTLDGGSALYFASILSQANPEGKVLTIDINPQVSEEVAGREIFKKYVEVIKSSSVDPELLKKLRQRVKGRKVMVLLDTLKIKSYVLKELALYSDLVSVDSYIITHDSIVQGWVAHLSDNTDSFGAVQEFVKTNKNFVVDRSCEKFFTSFCPSGFVKRVR